MPNILDELAEKINQTFKNNPQLALYDLKVKVYENGIVQVQGMVDVLEEKIQVEELIWTFPGVKKVENKVTVCLDGENHDYGVTFEVNE